MSNIQDPNRQIGYLQQCLASDKKPLGLFFGAGCPKAVGLIPDISGITKLVREKLAESKEVAPLLSAVEDHVARQVLPWGLCRDRSRGRGWYCRVVSRGWGVGDGPSA